MAQLWGGRFTKETDRLAYQFNASINFDKRFFAQDIEGSIAHAAMLKEQGILTEEEKEALARDLLATTVSREAASRIEGVTAYLHRGVIVHSTGEAEGESTESVALVPYHELLNRFTVRRRAGRLRGGRAMDTFLDFQPGDYVVHQDHGVSRFVGLTLMKPRELPSPQPGPARIRPNWPALSSPISR